MFTFIIFTHEDPTWYDLDNTLSCALVSGITLSTNFTDRFLSSSSSQSVMPHLPYQETILSRYHCEKLNISPYAHNVGQNESLVKATSRYMNTKMKRPQELLKKKPNKLHGLKQVPYTEGIKVQDHLLGYKAVLINVCYTRIACHQTN